MSKAIAALYRRSHDSGSSSDSITSIVKDATLYVEVVRVSPWDCYTALIGAVVTIWDLVITLDDEVIHVWRGRSTITGKPLYIFLRYVGTAYQVYDCIVNLGGWNAKSSFPFQTLLYAMDLLLAYRVLCLYRMNRRLVFVNVIFFVMCALSTAALLVLAYINFKAVDTPKYMKGCWSLLSSFVSLSQFPGLIFELWLFGLVVYRVISSAKAMGLWSRKDAVQLMIVDSLGWFAAITAMLIFNTVGLGVFPIGMRTMGLPLFRGLIIVAGCRMIIHMRKAYSEETETHVDLSPTTRQDPLGDAQPDSARILFVQSRHDSQKAPARTRRRLSVVSQATSERSRISWLGRMLRMAQRLGLPPPLKVDLDSMWGDAVITINRPSSGDDYVDEQLELSGLANDTRRERNSDEIDEEGWPPRFARQALWRNDVADGKRCRQVEWTDDGLI
ncbi:hypothetical protein FRB97_007991 [Tulasnella sp. 331]|nr:hypothetical protein FRB97_007991 [Tulasnella sp. 331]